MGRIITVYGFIGGVIVAIGMWLGMVAVPEGHGLLGMVVGYLTMLVAMTMVFAGVKRYRDTAQGGVIRFWPAFGVGLAIALIASLFYVLTWEAYMYHTNYSFMDNYVAATLRSMRAQGKSAAEIAARAQEMASFAKQYANPLFRMFATLSEIAPVGILATLVSAGLLRNSGFMPAREADA